MTASATFENYTTLTDVTEAQRYMALMREVDPDMRLANIGEIAPFRRPEDVARYADGLRQAGLPE